MTPRNPYICLAIVLLLGFTVILGTGGMLFLAFHKCETPQAVVAVVSGAAGSLASFLVQVPRNSVGGDDPASRLVIPNRP